LSSSKSFRLGWKDSRDGESIASSPLYFVKLLRGVARFWFGFVWFQVPAIGSCCAFFYKVKEPFSTFVFSPCELDTGI